jgi:hypothetical protein
MTILNMVYYKVDSGWKPWANTIAYYPLETNGNEASWKSWIDMITTWLSFSGGFAILDGNQRPTVPDLTWYKTVTLWYNQKSDNSGMIIWKNVNKFVQIYDPTSIVYIAWTSRVSTTTNATRENWHLLTITQSVANNSWASTSWTNIKVYMDGTLRQTHSNVYMDFTIYWVWWTWQSNAPYSFGWKMSKLVIDADEWALSDHEDFYNKTKSDYWL